MRIIFWGCRGSIPVPGRGTLRYGGNTTCVEVRLNDGNLIILDAGTGIRNLGRKIMKENGVRDIGMIFSHPHWDHLAGFPFFPVHLKSMKAQFDFSHGIPVVKHIGATEIIPIPLNHPVGYGYKILEGNTSFVFLPDNELDYQHEGGRAFYEYAHDPDHDDDEMDRIQLACDKEISRHRGNLHCFVAKEGAEISL